MKNHFTLPLMTFSMLSYLLAGYLLGLTLGFTLFDPNSDVYALLGAVLAILGAIIGILPFFRRRARYVFGAVIGYYVGSLISIVLFGDSVRDDLLEVLQRGGAGILLVVIASIIGAVIFGRTRPGAIALRGIGVLLGGFLGGYLFGVVLGLASLSSMIALAPFVLGSGIVIGIGLWLLQRRTSSLATA